MGGRSMVLLMSSRMSKARSRPSLTTSSRYKLESRTWFRINRRTPNRAIEIGKVVAQVAQIETLINATQKVICWDVIFKVERVKQSFLLTR